MRYNEAKETGPVPNPPAAGRPQDKPPSPHRPHRKEIKIMVLKQFTQCEGPRAIMHTNMGDITIQLYPEVAPKTVENFVTLAKKGYYNGLIFHRVIKDFMIQGGDPTGTGTGGPGYTIKDEFSSKLTHEGAGVLSMANAGPNTGGSQFFITLRACPWLDGKHAVFGKVTKGMNVVYKIGKVKTDGNDKPLEPVTIKNIVIKEG